MVFSCLQANVHEEFLWGRIMVHNPVLSARTLVASFPEPEQSPGREQRLVVVQGNSVLVSTRSPTSIIVNDSVLEGTKPERTQYLGYLGGVPCYAVELPPAISAPEGYRFFGVRELYGILADDDLGLAAYAVRIIDFDRSTRFCGRCGHATRQLRTERAKLCTDCNKITYPRISPAIIVLVKKGEQVLLARSPRFPPELHSILAGFVESGENLEECVHREVREEVGIEITNIRYFGSEPWPFPDSLMIGFVADYSAGEITIDNNEIIFAGWFDRDNLPTLPSPMSISRTLINAWIRREI
jgi:NAD+ diphosphatase